MITETDARAWIDLHTAAWVGRDAGGIADLFTPEAVLRPSRFRPAIEGLAAIRAYWQSLLLDGQRDVHAQIEQVLVSGSQAFCNWTAHFTWLPTNGIIELDGFSRISFADPDGSGERLASRLESWTATRQH